MLKIYSTLTRKKQKFQPINNKNVNFFVCGPTVYDYMHIGHAKTYTQFDIIVKYLRFKGYEVFYLQNITDIDNKIIKKAQNKNIDPLDLAHEYEKHYHEDEKILKINSVTKHARATNYIPEIVKQVQTLIKKGYAYKASDGYYYDITKFKDYGKLSGRTALEAEDAVSRIDDSREKRNKGDFCLWKFYIPGKSEPNEPKWDTEIGQGRPGWHIEDTAITETNFGPQYDIHGGARDLIFPHHEAEIAQIEAASGKKPLVKYWMHTGFLNISGKKMGKSLKNFITVREITKKYKPETIRFLFLTSHYHSPIDLNDKSLKKAQSSLQRINDFIQNIKNNPQKDNKKIIEKAREEFMKNMDNDFDTPGALAVIFRLIKKSYKENIGGKETIKLLKEINKVFDTFKFEKKEIPLKVKQLNKKRNELRKQKQWSKADEIRKQINKLGYKVEDTDQGSIIKPR